MHTSRNELFSERVQAGSRTYFFDVKETRDGHRYLTISESYPTPGEDGFQRSRIMVFEEHLEVFAEALETVMAAIDVPGVESLQPRWPASPPDIPGVDTRDDDLLAGLPEPLPEEFDAKRYPRTRTPWTADEEQRMRSRYEAGLGVEVLADFFKRAPHTVRRKLRQMGLIQ